MLDRVRWLLGVVVALARVGAAPGAAHADEPAPMHAYKTDSPNGAYVFVMLGNSSYSGEAVVPWEGYTRSGLYPNDGSKVPLWTVDWYAHRVYPASDGVHLVRQGPWATHSSNEAVSFFADGALLRQYAISELIADEEQLPHTVSHFFWRADESFDDAGLRYGVRTIDGNAFTFDVCTGQIVSASRVSPGG